MSLSRSIVRSIERQIAGLVRIPSRAGIDNPRPVLDAVRRWLKANGIACDDLKEGRSIVGICGQVSGRGSGPTYVLNATVDTAEFGDIRNWSRRPLSGSVARGWLYGRGAADSKAGVAIFCHVVAALAIEKARLQGNLAFLFDAEEHSGQFTGVRRFIARRGRFAPVAGVMIGYPGNARIVTGCRGFFRATVAVHGQSAHSGSSRYRGVNAVVRAAALIDRINRIKLPAARPKAFPLPPEVTVTAVQGGADFSTVPDLCLINVDMRLTPSFPQARAERALRAIVAKFDRLHGDAPSTRIHARPGWPAYNLRDDSPMVAALRSSGQRAFGRDLPAAVAGPSSIGNYLATLGIPATSGFGVTYRNLHAADECIQLASIAPTYAAYLGALRELLSRPQRS